MLLNGFINHENNEGEGEAGHILKREETLYMMIQ